MTGDIAVGEISEVRDDFPVKSVLCMMLPMAELNHHHC